MKKFKMTGIDNMRTLFFLLRGIQLNTRMQASGGSPFHQPTLKILNFTEDYLPLMEDKTFSNHERNKHYAGHPINDTDNKDQDFWEGGC